MTFNNFKVMSIARPQALVDNASWTTSEIDTATFWYMRVIVDIGATDIAMGALAITESDSTGASHANVTGLIFGTSTNSAGSTSTLPSATDDNSFFLFDIDLRGRKRYIDLTMTAGDGSTGTYGTAVALLWGETAPDTAAEYGASQVLQVPAFA